MDNALAVFQYHHLEIRTIDRDGRIWFVASDVAQALGYREAERLTRWLDEDESAPHNVGIRSENGVVQDREVTIISESGLYHALLKSRRPEAKPFRRWVTEEVLPSIRSTGAYTTRHKPQLPFQTPQIEAVLHPQPPKTESLMGPFFSVPDDHLHFLGVDLRKLLPQFRASLRLAREIAKAQPSKSIDEDTILRSAIHATTQVTGADLSLAFRGKPLHVDSVHEQFLSPTHLGTMFGLTPPARQINLHLLNLGLQIQGNADVLFHPTAQGLAYSQFRAFVQPDGSTRTHLFWRPSIIPVLRDYFAGLADSPDQTP